MKIEQISKNSYRVRKQYKGIPYTLYFNHKPTDREVTLALAEHLQEDNRSDNGTFGDYCRRYIASKKNILSPATIRTYNELVERLSDKIKHTNIYDITQELVQIEVNEYAVKHAPKSVRGLHGFIASVLGMYRPQFTLKTALPRLEKKKGYIPSSDDIKAILGAIKGTKYDIPIQLGILGLRRGEICALTLADLEGQRLTINKTLVYNNGWILKNTPKTDESNRSVFIPEQLAEQIRQQGNIYDGDPKKLNECLHRMQKKLNIPRFRFHDLRHYFASYASALGIPEADIMAMGGWKSDHVFKSIYRDSLEESRRESEIELGHALLTTFTDN